jgi:hypothetical protein
MRRLAELLSEFLGEPDCGVVTPNAVNTIGRVDLVQVAAHRPYLHRPTLAL